MIWAGLLFLIAACEGKLSDQQRKDIREAQKMQEIKIVTEAEITSAALEQGKKILEVVEGCGNDPLKTDSIGRVKNASIRWLEPGAKNAKLIENQLIEAYLLSAIDGRAQENIQKHGNDSLIFTKPVFDEMPDGTVNVKGMWSVWLSKKQIVLSIDKD